MNQNIFHLHAWEPALRQTAEDVIAKIHQVAPELEVLFMGAAALGLPGKNDIDLDILCDASEVHAYTQKLLPILGVPKEATSNLTAWQVEFGGVEIDCILSDPKRSHVPLQRKRFELLRANPKLLGEYKKLKEDCNGLPSAEYEKRKIAFFEKISPSN